MHKWMHVHRMETQPLIASIHCEVLDKDKKARASLINTRPTFILNPKTILTEQQLTIFLSLTPSSYPWPSSLQIPSVRSTTPWLKSTTTSTSTSTTPCPFVTVRDNCVQLKLNWNIFKTLFCLQIYLPPRPVFQFWTGLGQAELTRWHTGKKRSSRVVSLQQTKGASGERRETFSTQHLVYLSIPINCDDELNQKMAKPTTTDATFGCYYCGGN